MRFKAVALFAALAALVSTSAIAQQTMSQAGMSISAQTIAGSRATENKPNTITATGNVHVEASNKVSKTYLVADATKMTVTGFTSSESKGALQGMDTIKYAEFFGPVKMLYTVPKPVKDETTGKTTEVVTKLTACADNVTFNGTEGVAYLTGNVRITNDDPSLFGGPAVMTGEKATISLKKTGENAGPDFKIESPNGVSTIEATPKQEAPKKK